jgi:hypothetical protein
VQLLLHDRAGDRRLMVIKRSQDVPEPVRVAISGHVGGMILATAP